MVLCLILCEIPAWVSTALIIAPIAIGALGLIVGIYYKIKGGKYAEALKDGGKLLEEASKTIDKIKTGTANTPSREVVKTALKDMGTKLVESGLKDALDAKLNEWGLNSKS